jgi:hypothetical protein
MGRPKTLLGKSLIIKNNTMKKLGKYNLIGEHVCELPCKCGWNMTIGGENPKDLKKLKEYLKDNK